MTKKIVIMLILIPSWGMRMCSDLLPWFATKLLWKELKNIYRPRSIFLVGNYRVFEEDGGNVLPRKCHKNMAAKISLYWPVSVRLAIFFLEFPNDRGERIGNEFTRIGTKLQAMIKNTITKMCLDQFTWLETKMLLKKMEEMYFPENVRKIWQRKYPCIDQLASHPPTISSQGIHNNMGDRRK